MSERELSLRAADLARYVTADSDTRLVLPETLRKAYADPANGDIFAIRRADGRLVAASPPAFGETVQRWAPTTEHAAYFHFPASTGGQDYYGLGLTVDSAAGPFRSGWRAPQAPLRWSIPSSKNLSSTSPGSSRCSCC